MASKYAHFAAYEQSILALPADRALKAEDLKVASLELDRWSDFVMYYAPFDFVNRHAQIALVGITPGLHQMTMCLSVARESLLDGATYWRASRDAKLAASFSGPMRARLVQWLDKLGVARKLDLASSAELFLGDGKALHTTSAIRYSLFWKQRNYTGHTPKLLSDSTLREEWIEGVLAPELNEVLDALIVPLGSAVTTALEYLASRGELDRNRCLLGFPHPSGAYPQGPAIFESNRRSMARKVNQWFS